MPRKKGTTKPQEEEAIVDLEYENDPAEQKLEEKERDLVDFSPNLEKPEEESTIEKLDGLEIKEKKHEKRASGLSDTDKAIFAAIKRDNKKRSKIKVRETNIERLNPDSNVGLTSEQVQDRAERGYINTKKQSNTKSIKRIIFTNVFTFFNILMLAIAGCLLAVGAFKDIFFMVIVTANVVIGIFQEIRAKLTIDKLSILSSPTVNVIREGNSQEISTEDLVLDDIILLETGKQICSDSIVIEGSIEVNESLLTGESDAIQKKPGDMLYSGSYVVSGTCKSRVDAVGEDNYIEKLTNEAKLYNKPKSELLISLNLIVRFMAVIIIPIGAILFCMQFEGLLGDMMLKDSIRKTAGALIGMIPSGLYLLTSIALAVGVMKLAQNNVLVQELYCIEMLARVDCLCLDKTGTITDGTMTVKNVIDYQGVAGLSTKNIVSAMLNATNDQNMTAVALQQKFGLAKRIKSNEVMPFNSQRKYSAVTFDKIGTFVMGAPEFVLAKENYGQISQDVIEGAKLGLRVLLIAYTKNPIKGNSVDTKTLEPVSLIYIEDTIRADAIQTIKYFKDSGVEVKVISGDNPMTVSKVSERAGIENASEYISLDGLSDLEVMRAATKYTVFGRVSPAQKKLIVTTLKENGKTVAMTGDGVNDILALKEADCSISVASGSEAARNVSHLVLLDNNFGSMPKVVAEGRRVINNVAKVSKLFLTKTIFSLLLALYAINSGGNYPISTNQLFLIDMFCIGIPSFVLVLEPCNVKSNGKFLMNIIKGALPGAIVILFNAIIVLAMSSTLNLNSRDTSTLIVIIATFTCLIVLFQTCKPFNLIKKFMYALLFAASLFVVVVLPSFLDITPLSKIGSYYDSTRDVETIISTPEIEISKAGYVVIENEYTPYISNSIEKSREGEYLKVGQQLTSHKIDIVASHRVVKNDAGKYMIDEYIVLGGKVTSIDFSDDMDVQVTKSGDVYLNGISSKYNMLPSVTISKVGNYVINNVQTDILADVTTVSEVYIQDYEVYVNGNKIGYKIAPVVLSATADNCVIVGGQDIGSVYSDQFIEKLSVTDSLQYQYDGSPLTHELADGSIATYQYDVDVRLSEAGYYVINDEYTKFKASGDPNNRQLTHTDDGYLIINGTKTDFLLQISTTKGGNVDTLSVPAMLLMIALCALTTPFMTLLKKIIPWAKSLVDSIQKVIGRM